MDGFPDRYNILPPPFERVLDVAQRFGRFILPVQEVRYSASEHCPDELLGKVVGE